MFIYDIDDVLFILFIIIGCISLAILYITYLAICLCEWIRERRQNARNKNKSEIPDGYKPYDCGNRRYWLPPDNCVFCEHYTDIWWDFTNGIYMYGCELHYNNEKMTCNLFKEEKEK